MDEGGTWHRGRHWSSPHCARWGHSSPPQKGAEPPPIFGPSLLWPNGWMHQDATWYGGKPQPRDFVLDGTQPPSPKGAEPHPILGHVYCGETAAWIIMPFGTEAGLGLRDIVFDVDPAIPRKKGHTHPHPIFGPRQLWPNGWMDEDAAWYGSRPRPRPQCTRRGPSSRERGTAAPLFGSCLLWPRLPISATAELLYSKQRINRPSGLLSARNSSVSAHSRPKHLAMPDRDTVKTQS